MLAHDGQPGWDLLRIHVLQHVPFEGLGAIEAWLLDRREDIHYTRFFDGDPLPPHDAVDLLIVMGGPMSVNDEVRLPWLEPEKRFVREAIERNIAVLGVCLGAQLIASPWARGCIAKEIGWFPIQRAPEAEGTFRFPSECPGLAGVFRPRQGDRLVPDSESARGGGNVPLPVRMHRVSLARRNVRSTAGSGAARQQRCLRKSGVPDEAARHRAPVSS